MRPSSVGSLPIQRADKSRQEATGDQGVQFGEEDGSALGDYVGRCVFSGELEPASDFVRVYLEVADGTALAPDYWTAWCSALFNKMVVASGAAVGPVSIPKLLFPFLPSVLCKFAKDPGTQKYKPESGVITALDNAGTSVTGRRALCYGFWARAFDDNAYHAPQPALDWSVFDSYTQKFGAKTEPVPVLVWRHMDQPDLATPVPAAARRLSLDATRVEGGKDVGFDSMLLIKSWNAGLPSQFGVDKGGDISDEIDCLKQKDMTLKHLPDTASPGPDVNAPDGISGKTSFAFRYYSTSDGSADKDLSANEARALSRAGVEIVSVWQGGPDYMHFPPHVVNANNGKSDAKTAFTFACTRIHQPANTPIYFAIDCNVNSNGVDTGPEGPRMIPTPAQVKAYFQKVAEGYAEYLQEQKSKAVPYYTGVFGCRTVLDLLYVEGLATHFWQAVPPAWEDGPPGSRPNLVQWPHANAWQVCGGDIPAFKDSGVWPCRKTSVWDFEIGPLATAGQFKIKVGTTDTAPIELTATPAQIASAVAASLGTTVTGKPRDPAPTDGSKQWTLFIGGARDSVTLVNSALTTTLNRPPGFKTTQLFDRFVILDVAWGDVGGWALG